MPATKPKPKRRIGTVEGLNCPPASHKRKPAPVRGEIPASFKDIGHAVRESFERKAAALYERWQKGDVDLESSDAAILRKIPRETLSRHELERAMALFDLHGRKQTPKREKPPKIPTAIAEEIHRTVCPRGIAEKGTTAIALRSQPTAVIEAVPVDDLTAEERKVLARCESEFERSGRKALEGFVAMGRALREIRDSRLYRRTHSTFEAYLTDRCGLRKTSGYELIDGATAYELAQPIAAKLNMRFTAAAQLRPLVKVESKTEMQDVLRRAAKKIEPDRHGDKVPTMVGLEEAVRDSTATVDYTPEQLRKDAQQRRWEEMDRKRQAKAVESMGAHHDESEPEPDPGMFARPIESNHRESRDLAALGNADQWTAILKGTAPDGTLSDWWRGEPRYYAPQLVGLHTILAQLINTHLGQHDQEVAFRRDLAKLLDQMRKEVAIAGQQQPTKAVARRAK